MRTAQHTLCIVLFQCFCVFGVHCATISLSVVQNEEAPAIALEMSQTVEDQMFNRCFNAGHILSNVDIRFDGSLFSTANFGIKEAAFGLSDYLIVVYLYYGPQEIQNKEMKLTYAELNTITWRIVRVDSSKILSEKKINVIDMKIQDADPYKQTRIITDSICTDALNTIMTIK